MDVPDEPLAELPVIRIRTWDVFIATALILVLMMSILIWVWHPSGATAATGWLGVATGTLALVTTVLAIATVFTARQSARTAAIAEKESRQGQRLVDASTDQAAATRRQSDLSEEALSESRRPVLIPSADEVIENPKHVSFFDGAQWSKEIQDFPVVSCFSDQYNDWVIVKIRNVGGGPAIVGNEQLDLFLEDPDEGRYIGFVTSRVIAPGDEVPLTFRLPKVTKPSHFYVSITYRDLSYKRSYRGRIVFDERRPRPLLIDATVEDLNL
jgi:hypothetical protein